MALGGFSFFVVVEAIVAVFCIALLMFPKSPFRGVGWRRRFQLLSGWLIFTSIVNRDDHRLYFPRSYYIAVAAILFLLTIVMRGPIQDNSDSDVE